MNFFTSFWPESPALPSPRQLLEDLYSAATAAVAPGPALSRHLAALDVAPDRPIWVVALGKAAEPMAAAAVTALLQRGIEPAGGVVVGPAAGRSPGHRLVYVQGDHPEPAAGSLAASEALARTAGQIGASHEVWVLLSGGTTSLIGAPEEGLTGADLSTVYSLLLASGLDITAMNRIRKRLSRWGGGKLARALAPAAVRVFVVSDVIGDDLASIGSGPCMPDPTYAAEVRLLLEQAGLWHRLPNSARRLVTSAQAGSSPETPKPGDQVFARVTHELIASNRLALDAAAERASELGFRPSVQEVPISGEASSAGFTIAAALIHNCVRDSIPQPNARPDCFIYGGETTVTLGEGSGVGGRCQELALAAARALQEAAEGTALLAAGTDGRDGPTDAAGAIVDEKTWQGITASGRDPARDLDAHDSYAALDAAGALLRPGLTGTNVMDVVIGLCPSFKGGSLRGA